MSPTSHSREEWEEQRRLIEQLYLEEHLTMEQVRDRLARNGFHVTTRMLKTRTNEWNMFKKLRPSEIRTALMMLGPDRSQWPSQAPQFRINQRVVGLDVILRSCGRRRIRDPFEWIQTTTDNDSGESSNVELLTDFTPVDSGGDPDEVDQDESRSASIVPESLSTAFFDSLVLENDRNEVSHQFWSHYSEVPTEVNRPLQDPEIYIHTATAIRQVQIYCETYMMSPDSLNHKEPDVHHKTDHALFLDNMDEGISLWARGEMGLAIEKFRPGFEKLADLFLDLHPMAIATYLLLLCKLSVNKITDVSTKLLRYAFELAIVTKAVPPYLEELLRAICKSGALLEMPLLCLQAASDVLEANFTTDWKSLYVKERHCDALYYARRYGEAATRRAELLKLQESRYGPYARNVLWTMLNVGDDHLFHRQLHEAKTRFSQVMQYSEQHTGYYRAKSRVVALEGLAKVAYLQACELIAHRMNTAGWQSPDLAPLLLRRALGHANEAFELAEIWFRSAPRRIKRLLDLRDEVQAALQSLTACLVYTPMSS